MFIEINLKNVRDMDGLCTVLSGFFLSISENIFVNLFFHSVYITFAIDINIA